MTLLPAFTAGALGALAYRVPPLFGGGPKGKQWNTPPAETIDRRKRYSATLHTSEGDLIVDLLPEEAPRTVNNFVFLAREGFYDGVPVHRIIKDFMVQTGDPTGTGTGGPGYQFEDEPVRLPYTRGTVAMANAGPNTNGSQFFIVHGRAVNLPPNYTIFGRVREGLAVLDAIANTPVGPARGGERSRPQRAVRLESVSIDEHGG
jgi:cyclophilin family peptidyl-prolyl cis-trans isomerase